MSVSDNHIPGYPDGGCSAATDFLGHQSSCLSCPFNRCIDDLKAIDRNLLRRKTAIETAYKLRDDGKTTYTIASKVNAAQSTVQGWLTHRYTIEQRLQELNDMSKYVSWPRDNVKV